LEVQQQCASTRLGIDHQQRTAHLMAQTHRRRQGSFVVLAFALALLAACSKSKTAAEYIHDAQNHRTQGQVPAAIIDLKNALQQDAKNVEARMLLGQSFLDVYDGISAEAELVKAKAGGADADLVGKSIAEAWLLQGKTDQVLRDLTVRDDMPPAMKAAVLGLRARALAGQRNFDGMKEALDQGAQLDPHSLEIETGLISYDLSNNELAAAQAELADAQKDHPTELSLYALAGAVSFAARDFAAAEKAFQHVVDAHSWDMAARARLAHVQIEEEKLKEANVNLDAILKAAPKNPNANYLRGLSAYRSKDYEDAFNYADRALSAAPEFLPAQLVAGGAAYATKRYEQANRYLGQYLAHVPNNLQARKLLATVEIRLGHPGDAVKTLAPAANSADADAQILAMIGTAAAQNGDLPQADKYLQLAVAKNPDSPALRATLGATRVSLGETEAGIDELEKAVAADPKARAPEVTLAVTYIRQKDYDKALEVAERLEKNRPDDTVGFDIAGSVYMLKDDDEAATTAFLKAREIRAGDPGALLNLARLAAKANKPDAAIDYLKEILKVNPKFDRASIAIAELQAKQGKADDAKATLRSAIQADPDTVNPRVVLARLLIEDRKAQEALDTIAPILQKHQNEVDVLEVAGRAQLLTQRFEAAIATFKSMADVAPKSGAPHRHLAEVYAAQNNVEGAINEVQEASQMDPEDADARFLLARLLAGSGKLDDASKQADELRKRFPKSPDVAELDGLIALAQNRPEDAVADFKRAVAARESNIDYARIAMAEARAGHTDEGIKTLTTWLDAHPNDTLSRLTLVSLYGMSKDTGNALVQAKKAIELDPKSAPAKLVLAKLQIELGNFDDARKIMDELVAAFPQQPGIADTSGTVAMGQKRYPDAIKEFQRELSLADGQIVRLHLARAQILAGHPEDAEPTLLQWVKLHNDDLVIHAALVTLYLDTNQSDKAVDQAAEVVRLSPNNFTAENNYAWSLLQVNKPGEALEHAKRALNLTPDNPYVLDTLGCALLANKDAAGAVSALEHAASLAPKFPQIQFHLAQAYLSTGNKAQAHTVLKSLIAGDQSFKERAQAQKLLTELGG
jgi:cellulose synthase operon protein C